MMNDIMRSDMILKIAFILASLDFINGERSHTASNRKPPTGRANNINKQNGNAIADPTALEDVDDDQKVAADENEAESNTVAAFFNKFLFHIDESKKLQNMQLMNELKNTPHFKQKIELQNSNEVRQVENSGNSRLIDTQRNLNIQEPLPKNSNDITQIAFPTIKRAHANSRLDLDINQNVPLYDVAQSSQYAQSANCKRPQSCNAIFQSLLKTNELDAQLISNLPWSTASTPCMNTPRNFRFREMVRYVSQLNQPYRTVSHFGFNSPTRLPQPEHKHIPQNPPSSATLAAASSYEDVYGSPRYVDLCSQCYEQLLRLKTDFIPVRLRLRNLADIPKSSAEPTAESLVQTLIYETPAATEPVGLETVMEVDENKTSDMSVCVETRKNEQAATNAHSQSQSSFERRISSFNFSKESTNIHYEPPLIADSVLSVEMQSFNENTLESPAEEEQTQIVDASNRKIKILQVIEFDNWMIADGVQDCQYRGSSSETQMVDIKSATVLEHSSDSDDASMTRDERMDRKQEFQDIWEDHINFFNGKEIALRDEVENKAKEEEEEMEKCSIEEIHRSSSELDVSDVLEPEVFLGCSLIVHNLKSDENLLVLQTQQIAHQSTPSAAPHEGDTIDTSKQNEFLSVENSELSFDRMNFNATQSSDNENDADASDEISLNSLEYEILEKISVHNLIEKEEIFAKIDQSVRNKLTPRRLKELLEQQEQGNCVTEEQPTTSAQAQAAAEFERLNLVSSCSTFSIASNKDEAEAEEEKKERETVVEKTSKTANSSNTSIFSRQLRGKRTTRNFIRENIKNASKPRISKGTPSKCNGNPSAIFGPCPFGDTFLKGKNPETTSSNSSMDSPLYTFQKQQKQTGMQSLWLSMSPASSIKRRSSTENSPKSANSIRRKLFAEKQMKKRRASAKACSSSLLKLTPLRGIGLKPIAKYPTKRAQSVELEQNSDKENIVDSIDSQNNQYYTAESIEVQNESRVEGEEEEEEEKGKETDELPGLSVQDLCNFSLDEAAREAVLNDYIQELLDELEENDEE